MNTGCICELWLSTSLIPLLCDYSAASRVFWCLYFEVPILKALLWSLRKLEVAQPSMIQNQVLFNVLRLGSTSTDVTQNCRLPLEAGTFPRQYENTKKSQLTASAPCCTCPAQDTGEIFHNVETSLSLLVPCIGEVWRIGEDCSTSCT